MILTDRLDRSVLGYWAYGFEGFKLPTDVWAVCRRTHSIPHNPCVVNLR